MFDTTAVRDGIETIAGLTTSLLDDQYQTPGGEEDFDEIREGIEAYCLVSIRHDDPDDWIGTAINLAYNIYTHIDGECSKHDFVSFVRSNLDLVIGDSNA